MLIEDTKTMSATVRSDSVNGITQSTPAVQTHKTVTGSGVVKRSGWKLLKGPPRAAPVAYWKEWVYASNGTTAEYHAVDQGTDWFGTYYGNSWDRITGPNYDHNIGNEGLSYGGSEKAEALRLATGKLLNQLKGEGANIANMFGERKQTVKSVENVLNVIVGTIRDLRHGRISSAVRRMGGDPLSARKLRKKDIADQWLSLQYGWKPLLGDVYDLVTEAHQREKVRMMVFRASSKYEHLYQIPRDVNFNGCTPYPYGAAQNQLTTGVFKVQAIGKFMCRAYPDIVFAEPAALGVTNPLTVLWEVTPWSFVVDWFLPVGAYLEQLSADHGWHFYDGCQSTMVKNTVSWQWSYATTSYSFPGSGRTITSTDTATSYADYKSVSFRRSLLTEFPSARLPRLKNPVSTGHFLNGMALLTQLVSGGSVRKH